MSYEYTAKVWDCSKATGITRMVLLLLADRADHEGSCWPSIGDIAKRTLASERTVQRAIKELVELGEIRVKQNAARAGANLYQIILDRLPTSADVQAEPTSKCHPRQNVTHPPSKCHRGGDILSSSG